MKLQRIALIKERWRIKTNKMDGKNLPNLIITVFIIIIIIIFS